jgi:hypothetical protein
MWRAASTWQYNVAWHIIERHSSGVRLGYLTGEQFAERVQQREKEPGHVVFKCHDEHPAFRRALEVGRATALYCYRDVRDVAFSLAYKFRTTFEALIQQNGMMAAILSQDRFWRSCPNVLCQRYETLVADPASAVHDIALHLNLPLSRAESASVAEEHSLEANRQRTVEVARHLRAEGWNLEDPRNLRMMDWASQWHWNHIRDGTAKGWRELATPQQIAFLAHLCGPWLIANGYERDYSWTSAH